MVFIALCSSKIAIFANKKKIANYEKNCAYYNHPNHYDRIYKLW